MTRKAKQIVSIVVPSIRERVARAQMLMHLSMASLATDSNRNGLDDETMIRAVLKAAGEAEAELEWLLNLPEELLNRPAPDPDQEKELLAQAS